MKPLLLLSIFSLILTSCNSDDACKDSIFLLGRYRLDTILLKSYNNSDTTILPSARKNNWDKIVLIVEKDKYYFEGAPEYFRKYEGTWEYKPIGFDGDCYIFIDQKEGSRKIPFGTFNITIKFNNKVITLPFKKN